MITDQPLGSFCWQIGTGILGYWCTEVNLLDAAIIDSIYVLVELKVIRMTRRMSYY